MSRIKRNILRELTDCINPYAWVMAARNKAFDTGVFKSRRFDIPTICVGNISVGGTGKTPHIEYIARLLKEEFRIAVLSRGYGRKSRGYIKAGSHSTMQQIGDEPFQIKNKFKEIDVAVCEKRVCGIEQLLKENGQLQVVLLDDAFQHRHVKSGLNILLIDSNRPVWNDCVMPFGRLRERISGIERADIVIMTKCREMTEAQMTACREFIGRYRNIPVYFSSIRYGKLYHLHTTARSAEIVPGSKLLLVTGIAKPQPLKNEIEGRGANVTLMQYGDHHNFSGSEFEEIAKQFHDGGYDMIVTTEKDASRLLNRDDLPQTMRDNTYVMPIEMEILNGEEKLFNQNIYNYVTENSRNS
ncbi:MAG: tetraacyldisaccharide 4'-kinase [Bacteroidaceae bacterium]|nr:tetraacyldisaccharide 4'-kinase [Bacteroidaceae bacterium]